MSKRKELSPSSVEKHKSRSHSRQGGVSFPGRTLEDELPLSYNAAFALIKERIRAERRRAILAANAVLVILYWDIGKTILDRQKQEGWGAKIIDRLSSDLRNAFPGMQGLSPRNLKYMRSFAAAWPDRQIVQQVAAQIPWFHNVVLLNKIKDTATRLWYAKKAGEEGWSRNVLVTQIEARLHSRKGRAITNFGEVLSAGESDALVEVFKDPYLLDFLGSASHRTERQIEQALVDHIQGFLLELGAGFAFVGRQVLLEVGDRNFYADLLFYHLKLRCYVVIELKAGPFDPAFVGQMNLYLSAVDDLMRHQDDEPTIGLLLCKSKERLVVEYALRGVNKPMGVAEWETRLVDELPGELKGNLPSIEEIEAELDRHEA